MFSMDRILLPVVFSDSCRGASRYAATLADRFGSHVVVLTVAEPLEHVFGTESGIAFDEVLRSRHATLSRELSEFTVGDVPEDHVQRRLADGDPATEIIRFARDEHADLILMPTRGYGPFRRFLMGSVTAKVLHDATCPVWTGVHMERAPADDHVPLAQIACAIDLGPQTRSTLCWAAGFATALNAKLHILHALPPFITDQESRDRVLSLAKQEINDCQKETGTDADVHIAFGKPASAVCDMARQISTDVLVIGRGHGSAAGGRLPTDAYAITRDSPCPVVSV